MNRVAGPNPLARTKTSAIDEFLKTPGQNEETKIALFKASTVACNIYNLDHHRIYQT